MWHGSPVLARSMNFQVVAGRKVLDDVCLCPPRHGQKVSSNSATTLAGLESFNCPPVDVSSRENVVWSASAGMWARLIQLRRVGGLNCSPNARVLMTVPSVRHVKPVQYPLK